MNTTFFIGNGFDINIGLKTSYKDFYSYYQTIETDNEAIKRFKMELASNNSLIDWSDLERAFGQYTTNFNTAEECFEVYNDVRKNLCEYIQKTENEFSLTTLNNGKAVFLRDLNNPITYLFPKDRISINKILNDSYTKISILTFNYTSIIEKLVNPYTIPFTLSNGERIDNLIHVHGYQNRRMILGVNDETQIKNTSLLSQNRRLSYSLIKPQCNDTYKDMYVDKAFDIIDNTNLFCLFGLSIGETDNLWWIRVGNTLTKNKNVALIYFYKESENIDYSNEGPLRVEREDELSDELIKKLKIKEEDINSIKNRIFVCINSKIFKLRK